MTRPGLPVFTFDQAQKVLEQFNLFRRITGQEGFAFYSEAADIFVFPDDENEPEIFAAIEENGEKFYPIGAFGWIWEELTEFCFCLVQLNRVNLATFSGQSVVYFYIFSQKNGLQYKFPVFNFHLILSRVVCSVNFYQNLTLLLCLRLRTVSGLSRIRICNR